MPRLSCMWKYIKAILQKRFRKYEICAVSPPRMCSLSCNSLLYVKPNVRAIYKSSYMKDMMISDEYLIHLSP